GPAAAGGVGVAGGTARVPAVVAVAGAAVVPGAAIVAGGPPGGAGGGGGGGAGLTGAPAWSRGMSRLLPLPAWPEAPPPCGVAALPPAPWPGVPPCEVRADAGPAAVSSRSSSQATAWRHARRGSKLPRSLMRGTPRDRNRLTFRMAWSDAAHVEPIMAPVRSAACKVYGAGGASDRGKLPGKKHATRRPAPAAGATPGPGAAGSSSGRSTAQRARATGQRGWKGHPGGGAAGLGGSPASAARTRLSAPAAP